MLLVEQPRPLQINIDSSRTGSDDYTVGEFQLQLFDIRKYKDPIAEFMNKSWLVNAQPEAPIFNPRNEQPSLLKTSICYLY